MVNKKPLFSSVQFQQALLKWHRKQGRHNLPWQDNKTPYRVWVSEIMLQQTQVTTVIPYYLRFMDRFPTLEVLANAKEDEVLHYWTGLGYYARARNLLRTAQIIKENFNCIFPNTLEDIQNLPGIGRSTAGAILAIAFKKHASILDGNVKRVLTRLYAIKKFPGEKKIEEKLWQYAEKLTPKKNVDHYTQAIMDLGAILCMRKNPNCFECPMKNFCFAFKNNLQNELPISRPQKILPEKKATFLVFKYKNKILLEKRQQKGVWQGLWCFPELPQHLSLQEIKKHLLNANISHHAIEKNTIFRHTFSHYHLDILPVIAEIQHFTPHTDTTQVWYNSQKLKKIGLPAPIKKLIEELRLCE